MRLTCDFDVSDRLLPSFNMKNKNRAVRAQLSVGCKPGTPQPCQEEKAIYLLVCTAKNRAGNKYQLRNNIENFFTRFINEGKATIRLKKPEHDLILSKADPLILKSFLSIVRMASLGKPLDRGALSTLAPASAKQVEKPKSKMAVLKRKDYPVKDGFPKTLEQLAVNSCNLRRFDNRMLQLKSLRILDLSCNVIESLPSDLGKLATLNELRLCDNKISDFPVSLMQGSLQTSLHVLDLRQNKIKGLNPMFSNLCNLVNLKLDQNELVCLPPTIGKLRSLKYLTASKNKLKLLPADFAKLSLENVDLFGNDFVKDESTDVTDRLGFPTMVECAARAIKKLRIPYTMEDVPADLYRYLDSGKVCVCGQWCFRSFARFLNQIDLRLLSHTVVGLDNTGTTYAPLEGFLCSQVCLNKYSANPSAFWKLASR
ncbi:leucine-rich repeat protein 1-like [Lineus longissimus]|uniref:leucine-rich repeat protein 1-like n=1 Tax=Lineus longissimus TaxID=88925 RepID=UPI002B4EA307